MSPGKKDRTQAGSQRRNVEDQCRKPLSVRSQINDSYQAELAALKSKNQLLENKMCKIEDLAIRAINEKISLIDKQNSKILQLEANQKRFLDQISNLKESISSNLSEKAELEVKLSESQHHVSALEQEVQNSKEKFKVILEEIENQKLSLEENLKRLQEDLALRLNELVCLNEQITNNKKINARLLEEISKFEENAKIMEVEFTSKIFLAEKLATASEKIGNECKDLSHQLDLSKSELFLERQQRERTERELKKLRKSLEFERTQKLSIMQALESEKDSISQKSGVISTENKTLKKKVRDLSELLKNSDQKMSKLELRLMELQETHQLDLQNKQQEFELQKEGLQREIFKLKFSNSDRLYQVISFDKTVINSCQQSFYSPRFSEESFNPKNTRCIRTLAAELEEVLNLENQTPVISDIDNGSTEKVKPHEDLPEENAEIVQLKQELEALKNDNVRLLSTIKCIELQWENDVLSFKKQIERFKKYP